MKRVTLLIIAIVLSLIFVSCNTQPKEWSAGKIESDVYTSEFAEIKFTKDKSWVFETKNDHDMRAEFELEIAEVKFVTDYSSPKEYLKELINTFSSTSWDFGSIEEKQFCGNKYYCIDAKLSPTDFCCYARKIGDYIVVINIYSANDAVDEIESMFSEI